MVSKWSPVTNTALTTAPDTHTRTHTHTHTHTHTATATANPRKQVLFKHCARKRLGLIHRPLQQTRRPPGRHSRAIPDPSISRLIGRSLSWPPRPPSRALAANPEPSQVACCQHKPSGLLPTHTHTHTHTILSNAYMFCRRWGQLSVPWGSREHPTPTTHQGSRSCRANSPAMFARPCWATMSRGPNSRQDSCNVRPRPQNLCKHHTTCLGELCQNCPGHAP